MTNQINPQSLDALAVGRTVSDPFITFFSERDPTSYDLNYPIQKRWFNTVLNNEWILVSFTSFNGLLQANWQPISFFGESLEFLSGNSGGMVPGDVNHNINVIGDTTTINIVGNPGTNTLTASTSGAVATSYDEDVGTAVPALGVLNIVGGTGISTSGSGNTVTITNTAPDLPYFSLTPYIVGSDIHSQFTTISSAIAAGVSAGVPFNVFVKPGTYTENITLPANCNIFGFGNTNFSNVVIKGKISASYSGSSSITGVKLQTNSDNLLLVSGSNATIVSIQNCVIDCLNNTGISYTSSNSSSLIFIKDCFGNLATTGIAIYTSTSAGQMVFDNSSFINTGGSTASSSNSAGAVNMAFCTFFSAFSTSSTANIFIFNTTIGTSNAGLNVTGLTTAGTGRAVVGFAGFSSGSASDISVGAGTLLLISNSALGSSNVNAATGAGTMDFALLVLSGSGATNVSTQNALNVKLGTPV